MPTVERFDVLIVGGGPAGIAAAIEAARGGGTIGIVDDNPSLGGQIWRGQASATKSKGPAHVWFDRAREAGVQFLGGARVFAQPQPGELLAETYQDVVRLQYRRLILATGARELFLPFPGWTLPNVTGVGGLQALVKGSLPIAGKRVVVAGSGPLLLAVAAGLRKAGAEVLAVVEQAPRSKVLRFGLGLSRSPSKLLQALTLKLGGLRGIPYQTGTWPVEAFGEGRVEGVRLTDGVKSRVQACDYLACGFGLVPNSELPKLLGCRTSDRLVEVDELQATSVESIYCAGEASGIGGVDASLIEGRVAGLAAVGLDAEAKRLFPERERAQRFAKLLAETFALRSELRSIASAETIVCRCEDVTLGEIRGFDSTRAAKLQTRCGMGPCQGRICGPALGFLEGWSPDQIRPPVSAARIGSFLSFKE